MNNERSAYEKWMQHNRRDKSAYSRGPEPDPWKRTTAEEAGSYNLWNDRHRLNQEDQ